MSGATSIALNPMVTTNGSGLFSTSTDGYVQGVVMDDPAVRFSLAGGVLSTAETLPMWGGVAIYENTSGGAGVAGQDTLGGVVGRATGLANLTGFSVFNQAHHAIQTVQQQVPVSLSGMSVHFHRLGSGARIPLPLSAALAASLQNGLVIQQVSWDFTNQVLIAYNATIGALPVKILNLALNNSKVVNFSGGTFPGTWNNNGSCALVQLIKP